jgi:hypothetical protein
MVDAVGDAPVDAHETVHSRTAIELASNRLTAATPDKACARAASEMLPDRSSCP